MKRLPFFRVIFTNYELLSTLGIHNIIYLFYAKRLKLIGFIQKLNKLN